MPAGVLIVVGVLMLALAGMLLRRPSAAGRIAHAQHAAQRRRSSLNPDRIERELSHVDPRVDRLRSLLAGLALLVVGLGFVIAGVARAV